MNKLVVIIKKVKEKYGWGSNMSPFPVEYNGKIYRATEALFQCLRFDDEDIIEAIRAEKSPMGAKFAAKKHKDKMVIEQRGEQDIENMRLCLKLKVEQHPEILEMLLETNTDFIVEDTTNRKDQFWGARFENNGWLGHNWLGELWMELRDSLIKKETEDESRPTE